MPQSTAAEMLDLNEGVGKTSTVTVSQSVTCSDSKQSYDHNWSSLLEMNTVNSGVGCDLVRECGTFVLFK